jgi:hypothetical protein
MRRLSGWAILGIVVTLGLSSMAAAQEATPAATLEPDFVSLFDRTEASFVNWAVAGLNGFRLEDGVIVTSPVDEDLGLLYYAPRPFANFVLRLQFRIIDPNDNSGVYVRFRDPRQPIPSSILDAPNAAASFPHHSDYAANSAWMAVDTGFEVQIDEAAAGDVPGLDQHRTGAIYDIPIGTGPGQQDYQRGPELQPGMWNDLEITVVGDTYTVVLNGQQTTTFTNQNPLRAHPSTTDPASGYIGVQSHPFNTGHVDFRNIRIQELPPAGTPVSGLRRPSHNRDRGASFRHRLSPASPFQQAGPFSRRLSVSLHNQRARRADNPH